MKNLIKIFFDLNKVSFLLIILPFVTFNSYFIFNSHFFSLLNSFLLFFSLILVDFFVKKTLEHLKNHILFSAFFIAISVIFFYGLYIITFFQELFSDHLGIFLRGRFILFLFFLMLFLIQLIFRKHNYIKYVNIFLIIFCIVNFAESFKKISEINLSINQLESNFHKIDLADKSKKPVILIITDEYSSPDELFKLYNDSSVYNFSKRLQRSNWLVRNSSISKEISTIHSIGSLFNFNLSKGSSYSGIDIYEVGSDKLIKSSLYDSLNSKKIRFINFGIFSIGESDPVYNLYKYPKNFIEVFMFHSIYNLAYLNTGGFNINGDIGVSYSPIEAQNILVFNNIPDSLESVIGNDFFSYIHLYMPHPPFKFIAEFEGPLNNDATGYLEYWNFTNKKLEGLLSELLKSNKYRIILSGDHGFRSDPRLNSKNTFTAFYGFSEEDLVTIKSVQDLGNLINGCY